jgi:His-Xaa-Ser system protein HxsD
MDRAQSAITENGDGSLTMRFDGKLYSPAAVKKAVYKYAADCGAILEMSGDDILVTLSFSEFFTQEQKNKVARSFCNEVIDQELREQISRETEPVRNLILAHAFSRTSLLAEE